MLACPSCEVSSALSTVAPLCGGLGSGLFPAFGNSFANSRSSPCHQFDVWRSSCTAGPLEVCKATNATALGVGVSSSIRVKETDVAIWITGGRFKLWVFLEELLSPRLVVFDGAFGYSIASTYSGSADVFLTRS